MPVTPATQSAGGFRGILANDRAAPSIYSFKFDRSADQWQKQLIYEGEPVHSAPKDAKDRWALNDFARGSAGTGLHVSAIDIDGDGDLDLICPGKSGLYLLENLRR